MSAEEWGCRISKVRPKAGGAEITVLVTPEPPEANGTSDTFIETLVYVLGRARSGYVDGYAFIAQLRREDGTVSTLEAADVASMDGADKLAMLGAMRHMESNFIERTEAVGTIYIAPRG